MKYADGVVEDALSIVNRAFDRDTSSNPHKDSTV